MPGQIVEITDIVKKLAIVVLVGKREVNDEEDSVESCFGDWVSVHMGNSCEALLILVKV
ncbi:MAG: hypothetical protein O4861_00110 [Trichodesmium sp. St16_bin4-tuft]|uniref:hypothetical protein n=1 Tax=Trichodesmium erythraeum TaxID=1206 RepID=UPI0023AE20D5|nr:hypothetical protein [Trichodesmium sp. St4_bin8_1]MDE5073533.1 hypothetical protein [Trichodesmium sp. St5_bin8]MDE5092664.1 hypothetical protein [Trichodesmium sp. St18_bin3_1_1]MDE5092966.1 hypothetical protein [Trichodesmium sp. St11_bin5]MDE5096824.1 hypothetical protein [Trichodesmium sp. St16_bin4-tuft]MDE5104682.1 hypothetical protein [Trichodesmium sp. St19_bin2]MDT9338419.1 hypothetical protein [Trichodesmium erythraeum 21-75]